IRCRSGQGASSLFLYRGGAVTARFNNHSPGKGEIGFGLEPHPRRRCPARQEISDCAHHQAFPEITRRAEPAIRRRYLPRTHLGDTVSDVPPAKVAFRRSLRKMAMKDPRVRGIDALVPGTQPPCL